MTAWAQQRMFVPVICLVSSVVGTIAALVLSRVAGGGGRASALLVALVLASALGLIAANRFEWFVLGIFALRSSLDIFHVGGVIGGAIDPATALGALFIVVAVLWLAVQYVAGLLVPPSLAIKALWLFVLACALSAIASQYPIVSIGAVARVLAGVLMFTVLEQLLHGRPDRRRRLLWAFFLSALVPMVVGFAQALSGVGIDEGLGLVRVQGTFTHPNVFATYLVLILVSAVALLPVVTARPRIALSLVAALSAGLLIMTYTRVGWLSALVGLAYFAWRQDRRLLIALVMIIVLLGVAVPGIGLRFADLTEGSASPDGSPTDSLSWRLEYWQEIATQSSKFPMTGTGLATVQRINPQGLGAHSVPVAAVTETGLIGVGALMGVVAGIAVTLRQRFGLSRGKIERTMGVCGIAVALSLTMIALSETLVTQTLVVWYAAVPLSLSAAGMVDPKRPVDRRSLRVGQ